MSDQPVPRSPTPIRGSAAALVRHMETSLTVPTATTIRTFAVGGVDRVREELAQRGYGISTSRLLAYAVVRAAVVVPGITHRFVATDTGPARAVDDGIHLGIAVDVARGDGTRQVIVPVLRDADTLAFLDFVTAYDDVIAAARAGTLAPERLAGANLILTNTAAFGSTTGVPRLPAGPGAIVALGTIAYPVGFERLVGQLDMDRTCTASCTYDHRVIQGADSGAFLREVATSVSTYAALYADILTRLPRRNGDGPAPADAAAPVSAPDRAGAAALLSAARVVDTFRRDGHASADLDPLHPPSTLPPDLTVLPDLPDVSSDELGLYGSPRPASEALAALPKKYCGPLALDVWHLRDEDKRHWWFQRFETDSSELVPSGVDDLDTLDRLVHIDALERFMQRAYPSHKTLSVQGLDTTVLITQRLVELAAEGDFASVDIGMAHRGRLNILTHVTAMPYDRLFAEFEASVREDALTPAGITGDVKQHLGWETELVGRSGRSLRVALLPNPSHLEFVSPVALGATRGRQDEDGGGVGAGLAVLLHGDASFTGQGVVAETLNLHQLAGYRSGGAVHIVQDNQIGFTTEAAELRSTRWPSDIARGYDVPILHVNADDPAACLRAADLAFAYRQQFAADVAIHVLGYRRLGHSETDEPTFTQAEMYGRIRVHPTVVERFASRLAETGLLPAGHLDELRNNADERLRAAHAVAKASTVATQQPPTRATARTSRATPAADLIALATELLEPPPGAEALVKVQRVMDKRRSMLLDEGRVDWAHAEVLALAAVAAAGIPVRMSGQDVIRGAFTQRHLRISSVDGRSSWTPLTSSPRTGGRVQVYNSPLSETAVLGFEYGYSIARASALTVWEAQFGDFANGAQVITDQFLSSGHAKWGVRSRLVLLLPHGYEGSGPEHSSARLERYLQLAAEDNLSIAVPTTPAQYFALLVQQAHDPQPRPLVVLTPKSLLRHKAAVSSVDELASGAFSEVLARTVGDETKVRRAVLCTGKVFYDLADAVDAAGRDDVALIRVEQLYPFPGDQLRTALRHYPGLQSVTWAQEEPQNMGAARHVLPLLAAVSPLAAAIEYAGRPERAAVAEGYGAAHAREQAALVQAALGPETSPDGAGPTSALMSRQPEPVTA
ncbi:MAG: 2-oxoglutarate dehydrogenase complex [Frankiales bacterium]|nr:2-oxoglutarate dehydrogenase complex [Frankiales bacterium]